MCQFCAWADTLGSPELDKWVLSEGLRAAQTLTIFQHASWAFSLCRPLLIFLFHEALPNVPRQKCGLLFSFWATTWNQTHCSKNLGRNKRTPPAAWWHKDASSDGEWDIGSRWAREGTRCQVNITATPRLGRKNGNERNIQGAQRWCSQAKDCDTGRGSNKHRLICKNLLIYLTAILNGGFLKNKNYFLLSAQLPRQPQSAAMPGADLGEGLSEIQRA